VTRRGVSLFGSTLGEGVRDSIDPYFRGLSGRPEVAASFLKGLALDPNRPPHSLDAGESSRLSSALLNHLARQGVRPEFCEILTQDGWTIPSLGLDAEELSNLQNATGRAGTPGIGVALSLGDTEALSRARAAEQGWRAGILAGLRRIEDGGVNSLKSVQWFESPDTTLAGTQSGLAMNYLLDPTRPVFVFSKGYDGHTLKVSGRGTLWLVDQGLDLTLVCRVAAEAVGGEGGGHRVASGATIPVAGRDGFLGEADRLVGDQLAALHARRTPEVRA
jgi:RecJ-like exonuclease